MTNETKYELVNKETGEIVPVERWGDEHESQMAEEGMTIPRVDLVTVVTPIGNVVFENIGHTGDLTNERYLIRRVDSKMSPDNSHVVEDVVPAPPEVPAQ